MEKVLKFCFLILFAGFVHKSPVSALGLFEVCEKEDWRKYDVSVQNKFCLAEKSLICVLKPIRGQIVTKPIFFRSTWLQNKCRVEVSTSLFGTSPAYDYSLHVHENGDLRLEGGLAFGKVLSDPSDDWGNLGSFSSGSNGVAHYHQVLVSPACLAPFLGRGVSLTASKKENLAKKKDENIVALCVVGLSSN